MHACIALHALTRGALHTHGIAHSHSITLTALHPLAHHCSLSHGAACSPTPLHNPPVAHPPPLHAQTRITPSPPPSRRRRKLFPGGAEPPAGRGGDPRCCPASPRLSPASGRQQIPADPLRSPVIPAGPAAPRSRCPLPARASPPPPTRARAARPAPGDDVTGRGRRTQHRAAPEEGRGCARGGGGPRATGSSCKMGVCKGVLVQNGYVQWGWEPLVQNRCVQGVWESRVQGVLVQNRHVQGV